MLIAAVRSSVRTRTASRAAGVVVLVAASAASASNIVANGSFELPANQPNINNDDSLSQYGPGPLGGWTITANAVELVRHYFQPTDGLQVIDLDEGALPTDNRGAIQQTLSTVGGAQYLLSFDLSGNFQGNPDLGGTADPIKRLGISWGGSTLDHLTFDSTGRSTNNMGWMHYTYSVTAPTGGTVLGFTSEDTDPHSSYGPLLDNVSVVAVPAPGAMALGLAGLLGVGSRHRR